jgi:hypothetical protein
MFNRNALQEVAIPSLLGIVALAVAGYLAYSGNLAAERVIGFLAGLLGGFLSVLAGRFRALNPSKPWLLRAAEIVLSPLAFILFLPFSMRMGGGYFLGAAATFCFAWALLSVKCSSENRSTKSYAEVNREQPQ